MSVSPLKSTKSIRIPELSMVSLFTGGGGLDLGMEAAGFATLFATDVDYHSCETLRNGKEFCRKNNKPFLKHAEIVQKDINSLDVNEIFESTGLEEEQLDLLIGGPPCQAYSVFGKRQGRDDPRGQLVYEYLRILTALKPKVFLFENVYGLLTIEGGAVFEELCQALSAPDEGLKYELSIFRLNAANYGVPQFRDRVFIVGHREGQKMEDLPALCSGGNDLLDTQGKLRWRTVKDALTGLPKIGDSELANHTGRKHSQRIIDRYGAMSAGERDKHTRINKLDLEKPSYTIIVGSDKGGGKGHIHPVEAREVTPRESARIQTFPDWWSFSGTSRHPIRQVGNAVPPLLAAKIGNEIRNQFFGKRYVSWNKILERLDQQHLFPDE